MPQLDGLRAFAVAGVLVHHWVPGHFWINPGRGGVLLFFVLSGFLINGILLRARERVVSGDHGVGSILRAFYARRLLRIFPLYYATLAVVVLIGLGDAREIVGWLATYAQNVLFSVDGVWARDLAHFWTLAVEEQFYLVWPVVVLTVPRRTVTPLLIAAVVVAPVARVAHGVLAPEHLYDIQMHENLDSLGMGALLATLGARTERGRRFANVAGGVGIAVYVATALAYTSATGEPDLHGWLPVALESVRQVGMVFALTWVVQRAAAGFPTRGACGVAGRVLTARPIIYLGTISYGIYVLHFLPPWGWWRVAVRLGLPDIFVQNGPVVTTIWFILTLMMAALSWHFFEKPINEFKNRFPYTPSVPRGGESRIVPRPRPGRETPVP